MDKKIIVKSTNVKSIFENMEYGEVFETTNSAKEWLKTHRNIFSPLSKHDTDSKEPSYDVKNVATGKKICTIFSPSKEDLLKLLHEAKQLTKWRDTPSERRAILINRLSEEIQINSAIICQLEILSRGILSVDTKSKSLPILIDYLQYYSGWSVNSDCSLKDTGVAVCFVSDCSFIGFLGCILAPALAAGYNLVIQAAPKISPLVLLIIELAESIGIPEGTLILLPGIVDENVIFENTDVAVVASLGNKSTDIRIPIGQTFLAITQSKSSMIIFNNADVDAACDLIPDAAWSYQGLVPWSINTLLVQEDIFQTVIEKLKYRLTKIKMGVATEMTADYSYPIDSNANKQLSTIINEAKLQGIEVFQNIEKIDKFQPTLLIGGKVFGNNVIKDDDTTAVLTVLAFRTATEAINLANNTRYGFSASIWTENIGLANEVAKALNVGNVWVNSHGLISASTAFSPYKRSGYGVFGGPQGFYEFESALKSSTIKLENSIEIHLDKNEFKGLAGNDFHSHALLARKAFQIWSKTTKMFRSKMLRKVGDDIYKNVLEQRQPGDIEQNNIELLIGLLYSLPTFCGNGTSIYNASYNIENHQNPLGVIAIEAPNIFLSKFVFAILGLILLGNTIIVLCRSDKSAEFFARLSDYMSVCNTPGIFVVIGSCNNNVIKAALSDREIDAYIDYSDVDTKLKIEHMLRFYTGDMLSRKNVNQLSLYKNVWFNVGDSII